MSGASDVGDGFPETAAALARWVGGRERSPGAQLCVWHGGRQRLDLAVGDTGLGRPLRSDHLFKVYCAIKPVTALAVAQLVDERRVALDEPLAALLPRVRALADTRITLRALLNHTAGLHRPSGIEIELLPPRVRRELVEALEPPRGFAVGRAAAYGEFVSWCLLGWLVERVRGEPLSSYLRKSLLVPLGLHDTWVGMTAAEYEEHHSRLGVSCFLRASRAVPLLWERLARVCTECTPGYGGYSNARDLARLYAMLLERCRGGGSAILPGAGTLRLFCSPDRPVSHDAGLRRVCGYGLGFMTGLADHCFGDACSERAFGHSGNIGASFAFADPAHDLSVAVVLNGLCPEETSFLRRAALISAIYRDLGVGQPACRPPAGALDSKQRSER